MNIELDSMLDQLWPTKHQVPDNVRYWQSDVVGDEAVAQAAADLIAGKEVRFANRSRAGNFWGVCNIIRMQRVEADAEQRGRGYVAWYRYHEADGDVNDAGSYAMHVYHVNELVYVAIALKGFLEANTVGFSRLLPTIETSHV